MATHDTLDPWNWTIDQVVAELCTSSPSWQPRGSVPNLALLERCLRDHEVNGNALLADVDTAAMRDDFGLKIGQRAFVTSGIEAFKFRSKMYQDHERRENRLEEDGSSLVLRSVSNEFNKIIQDVRGVSSMGPHQPSEQRDVVADEPGHKRRKLDIHGTSDELLLGYSSDQAPGEEGILSPGAEMAHERDDKKRKRIAPTFVSAIGPDRLAEKSTEAEIILDSHTPTAIETTAHNGSHTSISGVPYVTANGLKRLVLTSQEAGASQELYRQGALPTNNVVSKLHSPVNVTPRKSLDSRVIGYLGTQRMSVDKIFYPNTPFGDHMLHEEPGLFCQNYTAIFGGQRLYVHKRMKSFLRTETDFFKRGRTIIAAVRPYPSTLVPKFQKPSCTIYEAFNGEIYAHRDEVGRWPEIDSESTQIVNNADDERTVTFNPLGPDMLAFGASSFDPDSLEKYKTIDGGDRVLPIYGESDEDNDYDLVTWKEMEDEARERNETLHRLERATKRAHITPTEVDEAITEGDAMLVAKWSEKVLPKRQSRAWRLWTKSRRHENKHDQIVAAHTDLNYVKKRIAKIVNEITKDIWTSKPQVHRQTRIMEVDVFLREDLSWRISVLEQKSQPEKPQEIPKVMAAKKILPWDDEEGEDIESEDNDSSSDDDLSDFIVPDDHVQSIEEEQHELNLADSEDDNDDDDAHMSDASAPATPRKVKKQVNIQPREISLLSGDVVGTPSSADIFSSLSAVKGESTLPKLPASVNAASDIIDLTMMSSDESFHKSSRFIDLVTPEKKNNGPRLVLKFHNSNLRTSSPISPTHTELKSVGSSILPPYEDITAIARYSAQAWCDIGDRDRLLIKVVQNMAKVHRASLFSFVHDISEAELWKSLLPITMALPADEPHVKGFDPQQLRNFIRLLHLFEMFVHCDMKKYYVPQPTCDSMQAIRKSKDEWFPAFFERLNGLKQSFQQLPSPAAISMLSLEPSMGDDLDEEDEEPQPSFKGRRSRELTNSNEDEESPPLKRRKRPVFENVEARDLREQDRIRLQEQEERRAKLQLALGRSGPMAQNMGRVLINDAKTDDQGIVYVHEHIASRIKPHQIAGIRFLWNQVVTVADNRMQGCLLAHTMGLGKSMQVITLLVAIAEAASSHDRSISSQIPKSLKQSRTLILCPPGLIDNWMDELLTWTSADILGGFRKVDASLRPPIRLSTIADWYETGGVLILGYEMFRKCVNNSKDILADSDHGMVRKQLLEGPNIVIADEAHKMKNAKSAVTSAAAQFKCRSRIALTGSPLANNVEEYHTMIDWVAPNYLGPIKEFRAKYVEPIQVGLYSDSTSYERRKSLKMLGVLKEDLAPKVNRADMSVLRNDLPPKKEFVITVALTELQRRAYTLYVRSMVSGESIARTKTGEITQTTIWHWLAILGQLCNHPACFRAKLLERKDDAKKDAQKNKQFDSDRTAEDIEEAIARDINAPLWKVGVSQGLVHEEMKLFEGILDHNAIKLSYKVQVLCAILDACRAVGDKTLIFSQSIPTLDFLEALCLKQERKIARLDGHTPINKRQSLTKEFNTGSTEIYLISTAAGGLGLNLYGANRVVIFDFKFNPIMEEQAVGRAYRIGQKKPTYVYRFVAGGTFETSVHNKTIFKMQLASRVVDKKEPVAYASKRIGEFLFEPKDVPQEDLTEFEGMDPDVLDKVLYSQSTRSSIRKIVQTDTFERDDDDKLTAEEKKEVQQMLADEQLKRTDPKKYGALITQRGVSQLRRPPPPVSPRAVPSNTTNSVVAQSGATRNPPVSSNASLIHQLTPPATALPTNSSIVPPSQATVARVPSNSNPQMSAGSPASAPLAGDGTVGTGPAPTFITTNDVQEQVPVTGANAHVRPVTPVHQLHTPGPVVGSITASQSSTKGKGTKDTASILPKVRSAFAAEESLPPRHNGQSGQRAPQTLNRTPQHRAQAPIAGASTQLRSASPEPKSLPESLASKYGQAQSLIQSDNSLQHAGGHLGKRKSREAGSQSVDVSRDANGLGQSEVLAARPHRQHRTPHRPSLHTPVTQPSTHKKKRLMNGKEAMRELSRRRRDRLHDPSTPSQRPTSKSTRDSSNLSSRRSSTPHPSPCISGQAEKEIRDAKPKHTSSRASSHSTSLPKA